MNSKEHELKTTLTGQNFNSTIVHPSLLEDAMACVSGFARSTEGIAVISDFHYNECYIYSGKFGKWLAGLPEFSKGYNSAFEDVLFNHADKDELLERHILELRFFNFLKDIPIERRTDYKISCLIRFNKDGEALIILHTSRYLCCDDMGNVLLGLCTYLPFPQCPGPWSGNIIDITTGRLVDRDIYSKSDKRLLSKRQIEVLRMLAKGILSKQIADQLNISIHTVNRHRQDILACLNVTNTAAAIEIGLRMGLI